MITAETETLAEVQVEVCEGLHVVAQLDPDIRFLIKTEHECREYSRVIRVEAVAA